MVTSGFLIGALKGVLGTRISERRSPYYIRLRSDILVFLVTSGSWLCEGRIQKREDAKDRADKSLPPQREDLLEEDCRRDFFFSQILHYCKTHSFALLDTGFC